MAAVWTTLDHLREELLKPKEFKDLILDRLLKTYVGVVISGTKASSFESSLQPWGESMHLPNNERAFFRIAPPNLLTMLDKGETPAHAIIVIRKELEDRLDDTAHFMLLWHRHLVIQRVLDFEALQHSAPTVGCRSSPILPLRIFEAHDAIRVKDSYHGSNTYSAVDERGFQVIRPHSQTIMREEGMPQPAPGISSWQIAGRIIGVNVADARRRPVLPIPLTEWRLAQARRKDEILSLVKEEQQLQHGCANAFLVADMLDCLGIVTLLSSNMLEGAWPDGLHHPWCCPLVVAFCTRLTLEHERFGLGANCTPADVCSNERLRACYDSKFPGIGEGQVQALDVAIRRAIAEAAKNVGSELVFDHLIYYRRSGQSCASRCFGLSRAELEETEESTYLSQVVDPITRAYAEFAKSEGCIENAIADDGINFYPNSLCPDKGRTQKSVLLFLLTNVERYLRLGSYGGKDDKGAHTDAFSRKRAIPAGELRATLSSGLAATLVSQAGAEGEESIAACAFYLQQRLEDLLQECDDNELVRCPTAEELLEPDSFPNLFNLQDCEEENPPFDEEAMKVVVDKLTGLLIHGPIAMSRLMNVSTTLYTEHSFIKCADCEKHVYLHDTLLMNSCCSRCSAPRCLSCAEAALKKKPKNKCKRCAAKVHGGAKTPN